MFKTKRYQREGQTSSILEEYIIKKHIGTKV